MDFFERIFTGILLGLAAGILTFIIIVILSAILPFITISAQPIAMLVGAFVFVLHLATGYNPFNRNRL